MKRRWLVVLAPVAVVALVVVALVIRPRHDTRKAGEADVEVAGEAVVERVHGGIETVTDHVRLHTGDTLDMRRGTAKITTNQAVFEARRGVGGTASTRFRMGRPPELLTGELLVAADHGAALRTAGSALSVGSPDAPAAARVSRSLAFRLSVYEGRAEIDSAGSRLVVPRLRAAEVASLGQVPARPSPLRFRATDSWDRRYLSTAITIDQELVPLARAFDQVEPGTVTPASLHVSDVPAAPELQQLIDRARQVDGALASPSDAIIGASVTSLGKHGTFAGRWSKVFRFHAAGATWGLVAMDQGVSADRLLNRVRRSIDQSPLALGSAGGTERASGPIASPSIAGGLGSVAGPGGPAGPGGASGTPGSASGSPAGAVGVPGGAVGSPAAGGPAGGTPGLPSLPAVPGPSGSPVPVPGIPIPAVPQVPVPQVPLPAVPLPSLPSVPSLPLPTVPLPKIPLPKVPLPTLPRLPALPALPRLPSLPLRPAGAVQPLAGTVTGLLP